MSTRNVECQKITWHFGTTLVMTLLSCNRSSKISRDVLETELKIMTSVFFFNIRIMWWLISTKVEPLKSWTFTKRFLLHLFNAGTKQRRMFNFLGETSLVVEILSESSLLTAFWKRLNCWNFFVCSQLSVYYFWWSLWECLHSPLYL